MGKFQQSCPSYRKQYVGWLRSAKKQETVERRIEEAIKLLTEKKKLGMK
ncbi:MAG: YdeI/OmpD-associated family protein [Bacteroidales bacterium]|nr:YdeI/OmpD-associated family protein [Bacteroidales bacterium]